MLTVMSLLRKRYDMIAFCTQTVPKAHHNLAQPIITLNSPKAIIVGEVTLRTPRQRILD